MSSMSSFLSPRTACAADLLVEISLSRSLYVSEEISHCLEKIIIFLVRDWVIVIWRVTAKMDFLMRLLTIVGATKESAAPDPNLHLNVQKISLETKSMCDPQSPLPPTFSPSLPQCTFVLEMVSCPMTLHFWPDFSSLATLWRMSMQCVSEQATITRVSRRVVIAFSRLW